MVLVDEAVAKAYRAAWAAWLKQIEHVNRVFLDGEPIAPAQIKGLLNREARAKEAYDEARARLLGIDEGELPVAEAGANPFKDDNPFR
jgi:hypothetical protein